MKIISKYKDYYDYMVSYFGIDPHIVYDRRQFKHYKPDLVQDYELEKEHIHICGQEYVIYRYKGKNYHTPIELIKLNKILLKNKERSILVSVSRWEKEKEKVEKENARKFFNEINKKSTLNAEYKQPVLIMKYNEIHIPILKEYEFPRWYPAKEMFQKIYSFLSGLKDAEQNIINKQTDIEKLQSHGFDKKKSFRHR